MFYYRHTPLAFLLALVSSSLSDQSFLGEDLIRENQVQNVLEHQPASSALSCKHVPTGPIEMTSCDFETVESVTDELFNNLHDLVETPFFRYFKVDLYRDCPFWADDGFCTIKACGITTMDESEVPEKWRAESLSKVQKRNGKLDSLSGCYYRDSDYCFMDDPNEGEYIDLIDNPEKFTGYSGPSAHRIWGAIYNENCFGISELNLLSHSNPEPASPLDSGPFQEKVTDETDSAIQCPEKRAYYKIISGLHTSISTHLCHDWFNQTSGEWVPNLDCFVTRVASHPERLKYMYFNTVLLMRAVARLGPYLSSYDYCSCSSPDHTEDVFTHEKLGNVLDIATRAGQFDETALFKGENANIVKEEFKEHFRNVSRIMDCVGCDKCRLWGKIQTSGVATALKILFEIDEKALDHKSNPELLSRSEIVALLNTLHRFTESLHYVNNFRQMWADADEERSAELIKEAHVASKYNTGNDPLIAHTRDAEDSQNIGFLHPIKQRFWNFVRLCRQCTSDCMLTCTKAVNSFIEMIVSPWKSFRTDKLSGPHSEF